MQNINYKTKTTNNNFLIGISIVLGGLAFLVMTPMHLIDLLFMHPYEFWTNLIVFAGYILSLVFIITAAVLVQKERNYLIK